MIRVVVVCFGTLSTRNIAKVLLKLNTSFIIVNAPFDKPSTPFTHIILSGGDKHVYDYDAPRLPSWVDQVNLPVLAICYGMQAVVKFYNKEVVRMSKQEKGLIDTIELFNNQLLTIPRWYNHFDTVVSLPSFLLIITGITTSGHIASAKGNQYHCVQYHPEHEPYVDLELFIMFLYQKTDSNK